MAEQKTYLFGPVPSRRLGLSLGVDIVPRKTCTQNCVYCQLGINAPQIIERQSFVCAEDVLSQLADRIDQGLIADYITFSGSGEPTLNSDLGRMIDGIRKLTDIKVAVITNGTLLSDEEVRQDCCKADLVLPSLDAGDAATFETINYVHPHISFDAFVDGLCKFRSDYTGRIWLEVFFIEGVNTSEDQIEKIKSIITRIEPDRIQLNTAVRPTAESGILPVAEAKLKDIAEMLGPAAEVVADFSRARTPAAGDDVTDQILQMLKRRPCSIDDICSAIGIKPDNAAARIEELLEKERISSEIKSGKKFYSAT